MTFAIPARAGTTDGTIDATYRYAWSENAGWVDFGSSAGNVHITDSALTGSAYGENIGWITLNPQTYGGVTNDGAGNLFGYAWSENAGWIDFSKVTIGSDGVFAGNAYGENIGWITFGTGNNKVSTDWRPASARTVASAPTPSFGGGMIVGSGPNAPSAASFPGYKPPRQQIIYPDGRIVYLDEAPLPPPPASPPPTGTPSAFSFSLNRKLYSRGEDIKALQKFLNTRGFAVAPAGAGSLGKETNYFGLMTQRALSKFQAANGITPAVGYFGTKTRNYINNLTP